MFIKYPKVSRSEHLSQCCVREKQLHELRFPVQVNSHGKTVEILIPFIWNTVGLTGSFHQGILTSSCSGKKYWQQVWCFLWQATSEGGKQRFRDSMSLRFQLCRIGVNGGLLHEFAEPCLECLARFPINHYAVQSSRVLLAVALPCLQPPASVVLSRFAWEAVLRT